MVNSMLMNPSHDVDKTGETQLRSEFIQYCCLATDSRSEARDSILRKRSDNMAAPYGSSLFVILIVIVIVMLVRPCITTSSDGLTRLCPVGLPMLKIIIMMMSMVSWQAFCGFDAHSLAAAWHAIPRLQSQTHLLSPASPSLQLHRVQMRGTRHNRRKLKQRELKKTHIGFRSSVTDRK